jgi:DNA segregation ATPase FtsK/SpoIIIE, S-DNA-T family
MYYLTQPHDIHTAIAQWRTAPILWLDTEIADWQTRHPKLSLIQVLTNPDDRTGTESFILDVLNRPDLAQHFIQTLMLDPAIEKVFHNASFDLRYLGQDQATNITCTLKLARRLGGKGQLGTSNLKLKTLAAELCQFTDVDAEAQSSDWGRRQLSAHQLHYAAMDVVYLAAVHRSLLQISTPAARQRIAPPMSKSPQPSDAIRPNAPLSPTKVRTAFECPRLFYLGHQHGLKTLFVPPDSISGVGKPFHHLADRLIDCLRQDDAIAELFTADSQALDTATIAAQIQQRFYAQQFFPHVQQNPSQATGLLNIWQGLRGLIGKFAELLVTNRQHYTPSQLISATFPTHDRRLEKPFTLPNGSTQKVAGEYDCLVFNAATQRLCVVELKTYAPIDPTAQLAQVALYSDLLHERHQTPIDAAVYCVLPTFQAFDYTWEQLQTTVHQLIPHRLQQMQQWLTWEVNQPNPPPQTAQPKHLCPICPQQSRCQTEFGGHSVPPIVQSALPPQTPQTPTTPIVSERSVIAPSIQSCPTPDRQGEELVETFAAFNLGTTYEGAVVGPAFVRIKLKPQLGVKVSAMMKLSDELRVHLGLAAPPMIAPQAGYVSVDLPRPDRQTAHFDHYIQHQTVPPDAPMNIAIGIDLDGQLCEANLSDPNTCHFLVGGTTGSGKSEFLRAMLLSLLVRHPVERLQIVLVDPKRVTFPEFEHMPWLLAPIVKDSESAIAMMEQLVDVMESRYRQFERAQCNDLTTYNQKIRDQPTKHLARIVCIFDEYADFMAEKEIANSLEQSIKRLGAMARAAGIHLIIATQRPEAKVVTPLIRSNLPGRIALRTASTADSAIILGEKTSNATHLLGKGDLLYLSSGTHVRLQSLFAAAITLPRSD